MWAALCFVERLQAPPQPLRSGTASFETDLDTQKVFNILPTQKTIVYQADEGLDTLRSRVYPV